MRRLYSDAKVLATVQIVLSVPIVALWTVLATLFVGLRVYAACWGLFVFAVDVLVFAPWEERMRSKAAAIQELFDCTVLHMDWPALKAGSPPEPEAICAGASRYLARVGDEGLRDWYPPSVRDLPLHLARIVCQRANCWWDAELRRRYADWTGVTLVVLIFLLVLVGLAGHLDLNSFMLSVIMPLLPAIVMGARQHHTQMQAATRLDNLREHADVLWNDAINGIKNPDECARESRSLQDEIFDSRRRNPSIPDCIYRRLKRQQEEQMNRSAEDLVREALDNRHKWADAGEQT
jgi:hypothetical protein